MNYHDYDSLLAAYLILQKENEDLKRKNKDLEHEIDLLNEELDDLEIELADSLYDPVTSDFPEEDFFYD